MEQKTVKKNKLVYGIGRNDFESSVNVKGVAIKSYQVWQDMLKRCYSDKYKDKNPTYKNCKVCEEWLSFSTFNKWFEENYPKHLVDKVDRIELDKDLLVEGNKVYSPETCVFLPKRINSFMTNKQSNNTSGRIGVCFHKSTKKWLVNINDFEETKRKHIGLFSDLEEASEAYQVARAEQAEKAKAWLRELGYAENIVEKIR